MVGNLAADRGIGDRMRFARRLCGAALATR